MGKNKRLRCACLGNFPKENEDGKKGRFEVDS
jgi:hypothetical protein